LAARAVFQLVIAPFMSDGRSQAVEDYRSAGYSHSTRKDRKANQFKDQYYDGSRNILHIP